MTKLSILFLILLSISLTGYANNNNYVTQHKDYNVISGIEFEAVKIAFSMATERLVEERWAKQIESGSTDSLWYMYKNIKHSCLKSQIILEKYIYNELKLKMKEYKSYTKTGYIGKDFNKENSFDNKCNLMVAAEQYLSEGK